MNLFSVVYLFDGGLEEFIIVGIYTKRSDADDHVAALKKNSENITAVACEQSLARIEDDLIAYRLRKITIVNPFHELHGANGMPAAVVARHRN